MVSLLLFLTHLALYYSPYSYLSLPLSSCSSRLKNKMWYGLLGSKELLQRSYRKLEERVHLEVSGKEGNPGQRQRKSHDLRNQLSPISLVFPKL